MRPWSFRIAAAAALLLSRVTLADQALPSFPVDTAQTSVSGLSSGGFMAVQFHTAYSARIMGVGVVAGGPFDCAFANNPAPIDPVSEVSAIDAGIKSCMDAMPAAPDGVSSLKKAQQFAALDRIDRVNNLARSRVYIFSGTNDHTVIPSVVAATNAYYRAAGVPEGQIQYVHDLPAGHGFVSPAGREDCGQTESPYIIRCTAGGQAYDQAGAILTQIYGHLNAPSLRPTGRTIAFDQAPFDLGGAMGPLGFLYVPRSCDQGVTCRIHVVFHGCEQAPEDIGNQFYTETGYNQWADTNEILVVYPQAPPDHPLNPKHCWDWWGYTGPDFDTKGGPQMSAISKILDSLVR
jgi:poly(3-hydroxybutyrate) depolymerase